MGEFGFGQVIHQMVPDHPVMSDNRDVLGNYEDAIKALGANLGPLLARDGRIRVSVRVVKAIDSRVHDGNK